MKYASTTFPGRVGFVVYDDDPTLAPIVARRVTFPMVEATGKNNISIYVVDTREYDRPFAMESGGGDRIFCVSYLDFASAGVRRIELRSFARLMDAERYIATRTNGALAA